MTEPHRHELISTLSELARRYPHWRFGQLVANAAGWSDTEIWDVEDDELLAAVRTHLQAANSPAELLGTPAVSIVSS